MSLGIDEENNLVKSEPDATTNLHELYEGSCNCNVRKDTKNFLLMGYTGSGKTTFIDCFVNYLLGVEQCDKFRYKLADESKIWEKKFSA